MTQPPNPGSTLQDALPGLPAPGDLIAGKYRIERLLGKGGMGAVYAAQHEILLQKVAIKVLLREISGLNEAVARFMNEARAAARIQSEHVARVLDVGDENGTPFMVMEYLEGEDLGHMLDRRGPLPLQEVVDSMLEALEAIAQAHALQIVHRDLKPANLFASRRQDGQSFVKVLDFGISKATNPLSPGSGGMTSTKAMLGSPYYMSPEQLRSSKSVDSRTDIWSIGVIMYELLVGSVPHNGENLGELFAAILEQPPPPMRPRRPDLPPDIEAIVMRCLQRYPDHRFGSARELAGALAPYATSRGHIAAERIRASTMNAPGKNPHAASVYAPSASSPGGPLPQGVMVQSSPGGPLPPPTAPSGPGMPAQTNELRPGSRTAAAWGQTGGAPPGTSKKGLVAALAAVGAVVIVGGVIAGVVVRQRSIAAKQLVHEPLVATVTPPPPPPVDTASLAVPPPTAVPTVATAVPDAAIAVVPPPPPPPSRPGGRPGGGRPAPQPPGVSPPAPPPPPSPGPPPPPAPRGDDIPGAGRR